MKTFDVHEFVEETKGNFNTFKGIRYTLCVRAKECLLPGEKPRELAKRMYPELNLKCIGRGIFKNNVRCCGVIQKGFSSRKRKFLHLYNSHKPEVYLFFKLVEKK